jgi:hypothetical protein
VLRRCVVSEGQRGDFDLRRKELIMSTSTSPSINWNQMQHDYYQINPYPHAEVAYQPK